jgi:hypothetical protein
MDAFSYLSVLISVILGLAVTQVLQGYRALALARAKVRWYWPTVAWSGIILLMTSQNWWSMFGLTSHKDWTFASFAAILVHASLIYMMAALVLPDLPPDEGIDLKAHYYREIPPFFGAAALAVAWSGVREWIVEGHFLNGTNLAFHGLYLAMALTALASRRERVHEGLTASMVLFFTLYIVLLFARLH